jgi:hypothetical protein
MKSQKELIEQLGKIESLLTKAESYEAVKWLQGRYDGILFALDVDSYSKVGDGFD